ncbi:MAG: hypothetical protein AAGB01_00575 [Cyanobacteria bacterium P01_F01_bin.42]
MNHSLEVVFGFLGGTIVSVQDGYKVFPKTPSERPFKRLADAKWFLALHWCDRCSSPAGILNNTEQFSFQNEPALRYGSAGLIPTSDRAEVFNRCLSLGPNEIAEYKISTGKDFHFRTVEIQGIEIDPRYGKVALVKEQMVNIPNFHPAFQQ